MRQQKKAIIDIDNSLYHFCDHLFERLQKLNAVMRPPNDWIAWDFRENYCSKEQFLGAIKDIHLNQDDDKRTISMFRYPAAFAAVSSIYFYFNPSTSCIS
jgi:hypothetical protein